MTATVPRERLPIPAVIYAAKSTTDTHGSIPTQLADCEAAAIGEGREVVAAFQDEGFSAFSGDRGPGLARAMLAAADCGGELWVQHSDRLARGGGARPGDAMHLAERWFDARRAGFRLRSVQDDRSLQDLVLVAVMGDRNHEDSKRKSAATRDGLRRRAERGLEHGGGVPSLGYERSSEGLRPVPHEAATVTRIFREHVGGVKQQVIARRLNDEGIKTKRGRRFTQPSIHKILANPIYVGKLRSHGQVIPGVHQPIIDASLWGEAQALLKRAPEDRGRPAEAFLLGGRLLRCRCGAPMVPRSHRDCYLCLDRHHDPRRCGMPTLPRALVDDAVTAYFTAQLLDREESRRRAVAAASEQAGMVREQRLQAERAETAALEAVERVTRDYLSGELPAARFDHLLVVAEAEAAAAKEQASRLRDRERALAETPDLPDVLSDLHERLLAPVKDAETTAALRAALRRVFSHFEVTTRPPRMIPVGPTPDALDDPQPPVDAAEAAAIADRVAEGLGVTVEEDGLPFKWESRWYLEPVLLDDVDLGLEVDRWAIVDPVAVERNNSYSARAASIALGRAPWEPEGQVPARYDGRMRILTWGARSS